MLRRAAGRLTCACVGACVCVCARVRAWAHACVQDRRQRLGGCELMVTLLEGEGEALYWRNNQQVGLGVAVRVGGTRVRGRGW